MAMQPVAHHAVAKFTPARTRKASGAEAIAALSGIAATLAAAPDVVRPADVFAREGTE